MKPKYSNIDNLQRGDSNGAHRGSRFPLTDYRYQGDAIAGFAGHCGSPRFRNFRNISGDYFKNEARGTFVAEATLFALIVATAAVPMIQGMRAGAELLRAFGAL